MESRNIRSGGRSRRQAMILALLVATAPLAACDLNDLLDVEAAGRVLGRDLSDPTVAPLLVESTISDFECAFAFYVVGIGLLSDELVDSQLAAATWDFDRRGFANGEGTYATNTCNSTGNVGVGMYRPVSTARWSGDNILRLLSEWTDEQVENRQALIAQAGAYAGYSHILLGEGFCSAAVDGGQELTPAQIFERAEERFTTAIAAAQASDLPDIRNMALVGRARVRRNLGKTAEALADASAVPTSFVREASYNTASSRSGNHVFRWNNRFNWASVDPRFHELTVDGVPDPRVPVVNSGNRGADAFTIVWHQRKYTAESTPIPIATGVEARLLEAELRGGVEAVNIISALRARHDLPAYTGGTSADEIRDLIILERSRELFLTGQRVWDTIRFNLPLDPAPGTPYPLKGGVYGDTKCLLLPQIERQNNPNIS